MNSDSQQKIGSQYTLGVPLLPEHQGKCFSCGFLRLGTSARGGTNYREVEWDIRWGVEQGLTQIQADSGESVQPTIDCLLGVQNLHDDLLQLVMDTKCNFEDAFREIIWEDRKCQYWQPYHPSKPIQQYYMESFMQRLEELRQQFDLKQKEESKLAVKRERKYDRRIQRYIQKSNNRMMLWAIIAGILFTIAQIITAIILSRESFTDHVLRRLLGAD